jgi:hypothetical protein
MGHGVMQWITGITQTVKKVVFIVGCFHCNMPVWQVVAQVFQHNSELQTIAPTVFELEK